MTKTIADVSRRCVAAALLALLAGSPVQGGAQQQPVTGGSVQTIRVKSEIVLTNVVVRDKKAIR